MRVLGVIRLSRETEESTSPERQKEAIQRWADLHGHTIVGWVYDLDVSGAMSPFARPELGKWLSPERSDAYDLIVGSKVDRLSRKLLHFATLIEWAEQHGKGVASATEPINTIDRFGKMIAQILIMFAEFERDAIQERNLDSQKLAKQEGRWHGGNPPFGFAPVKHPSGKGWVLAPDPDTSEWVKEISRKLLEGDSLNAIANYLNENGVLTATDWQRKKSGKELKFSTWESTTLSRMLRSRTLLGIAEKGGEMLLDQHGIPIFRSTPILTKDEWDEVQQRLQEVSITKTRTDSATPLLQVAFCGRCGQPHYGNSTRSEANSRPAYYRCKDKFKKIDGCDTPYIRAEHLEQLVSDLMLSHLGKFTVVEEVYRPGQSHAKELAEAVETHADLLKRSEGKKGLVLENYNSQLLALEERINRLSETPETPAGPEYRSTGRTWADTWSEATIEGRRKLLLKYKIRIEATKTEGPSVSVPRYDRNRDDEAVVMGRYQEISYAFCVPKDLLERSTRLSSIPR